MRKFILLGVLAATTFTLATAPLKADEPTPAAATRSAPQAGRKLTDEDLLRMVEDLGYEITKRPNDEDKIKRISIKVTRGEMDVPMSINLNGDKTLIQTFVNAGKLGEAELANAPALLKLLELNDGYLVGGKGKFLVNSKSKVLWLSAVSENRGVTPKVLRDHIEESVAAICDNRDAWDFTRWTKPGETKTEVKK